MLCEYGNCHVEQDAHRVTPDIPLPVIVSITQKDGGGERKRFCSEYHAALWLLRWAKTREQNLHRRMSAMALLEAAYKE